MGCDDFWWVFTDVLDELVLFFGTEHGSSRFLQNFGTCVPDSTASDPRILCSSQLVVMQQRKKFHEAQFLRSEYGRSLWRNSLPSMQPGG